MISLDDFRNTTGNVLNDVGTGLKGLGTRESQFTFVVTILSVLLFFNGITFVSSQLSTYISKQREEKRILEEVRRKTADDPQLEMPPSLPSSTSTASRLNSGDKVVRRTPNFSLSTRKITTAVPTAPSTSISTLTSGEVPIQPRASPKKFSLAMPLSHNPTTSSSPTVSARSVSVAEATSEGAGAAAAAGRQPSSPTVGVRVPAFNPWATLTGSPARPAAVAATTAPQDQDRRLRAQQDAEYAASVEADNARRQEQERIAADQKAEEEAKKRAAERRQRLKQQIPPEPSAEEAGTVVLSFRLETEKRIVRVDRRFHLSDTTDAVLNFLESRDDFPPEARLEVVTSALPKVQLLRISCDASDNVTLHSLGITSSTVILVRREP